jgi:hypothetical protein
MTRDELIQRLRTAQVAGEAFHVEHDELDAMLETIAGRPSQPFEISPVVTEKTRPICRWHTDTELCDPDRGHIQIVGYFETLVVPFGVGDLRLRPGERLIDKGGTVSRLHSFGASGPRPPEPDDGSPLLPSRGVVWLQNRGEDLMVWDLKKFVGHLIDCRILPLRSVAAAQPPLTGERVRTTPQWKHDPGTWGADVPVGALGVIVRKGEDDARGAYVELLFREVRSGLVAVSVDDFATEVRLGAIVRETIEDQLEA